MPLRREWRLAGRVDEEGGDGLAVHVIRRVNAREPQDGRGKVDLSACKVPRWQTLVSDCRRSQQKNHVGNQTASTLSTARVWKSMDVARAAQGFVQVLQNKY